MWLFPGWRWHGLVWIFIVLLYFGGRVFCSSDWPWTEPDYSWGWPWTADPPASTSLGLELEASGTWYPVCDVLESNPGLCICQEITLPAKLHPSPCVCCSDWGDGKGTDTWQSRGRREADVAAASESVTVTHAGEEKTPVLRQCGTHLDSEGCWV